MIYGSGAEIWPFYLLKLRKWSTWYRQVNKMPISWLLGHKSKNWGHFLIFNCKSLRKQSILIFLIYGSGSEILGFFPVTMVRPPPPEVQKTQWPYFGSWAPNQKTKDTFFSSIFKVWESKVSFFLIYGPGAKILAFVLVTMVHSPPLIITPS